MDIRNRRYFFKVVRDHNPLGVYTSAFLTAPVYYSIGTVTLPRADIPGSKLFVFESLEEAKDFCICVMNSIFLCTCTNPTVPPTRIASDSRRECFVVFWKSGSVADHLPYLPTPPGTILVDSVELIGEIKV